MSSQTSFQKKLAELKEIKPTHKNSRHPKIQKVAEYLRNRKDFEKHYSPMFLSIGPIHHASQNLKSGDNYKLAWAAKYIQTTQHGAEFLHQKIIDNIDELKSLFADDVLALVDTMESLKDFSSLEEKLSWLLFTDGCSLLYILINVPNYEFYKLQDVNTEVDQLDKQKDGNANTGQFDDVNIIVDDELDIRNMKVDQILHVIMDVLLLENQLPYLVPKLLWINDIQDELIGIMVNFLKFCTWATSYDWTTTGLQEPTHLLDLKHKIILSDPPKIKANEGSQSRTFSEEILIHRTIQDLTTVGIKLKPSRTRSPRDVEFSMGYFAVQLTLPRIIVDHNTTTFLLNLMAYEMCSDFKNNNAICSFVVFLDSLIDHPEDVKKLRSEGILLNLLGSDEEVANLFSMLTTDMVLPPQEAYYEVKAKIHEYHSKRCKIWLAQGYHTYFGNPWAITGFLAAFMALALTFLQTWFSIFPSHN